MAKDVVIVFDCGATNVRAVAIDAKGKIVASESLPNNTIADPFYPSGRIWDINDIWGNLCIASQKITANIDLHSIAGVTVTTFGVDGTFFSEDGNMLYPVISWQCERTGPIMAGIGKYIPLDELYHENGVMPFNFNTINKLIWFVEHKPEIFRKSKMFLFMPSIFNFYLTGVMVNDTTMAGTSMLTSLSTRNFSEKIMGAVGIPASIFGNLAEPGAITGNVTKKASIETGLPVGIPVVSTGHDTQFAIFGSGAGVNEPVLSSGTWEILMVRAGSTSTGKAELDAGITTELDSCPGLYNIGNQWIASGILEWIRKNLYPDIKEDVYETMISGAEKVPAGSNGVRVVPRFYDEINGNADGQITGLTLNSTRDEICRAALESLSSRLAEGKKALERAGQFRAGSIICVGGGSKNRLWNKLRAEYSGVPLKIIEQKETTVLGASLFVQAAAGNSASAEDARKKIDYRMEIVTT